MPTKRTPRSRPPKTPFTPAALAAFKRMQELEYACTCAPDAFADTRCSSCKEWVTQQSILHKELRLPPWAQAVEHPEAAPPSAYPVGSYAYNRWKPDLEAQERWRALEEAVRG